MIWYGFYDELNAKLTEQKKYKTVEKCEKWKKKGFLIPFQDKQIRSQTP